MQTPAPILPVNEFAEMVSISRQKIFAMIEKGELAGVFTVEGEQRDMRRICVLPALRSLGLSESDAREVSALYAPAQPAPVCVSYFVSVPSTLQPVLSVVQLPGKEEGK
jgi:hypothetical protein